MTSLKKLQNNLEWTELNNEHVPVGWCPSYAAI